MMRLALILYAMVGVTFAGSAIVVALVSGLDTLRPIVIAAAIGALAAVPVAAIIARKILETR
ncbi:MAG: CTP synthetase [Pseudomonadota bacterium]